MRFSPVLPVAIAYLFGATVGLAAPASRPAGWEAFNEFTIRSASTGSLDRISWKGLAAFETNDIRIDVEQSAGGKVESGTLLLVGGDTLLAKGVDLPSGAEIDVLDAPVLTLRIVTKVLATVFPDGPDKIQGKVKVDHVERTRPISVGTASAGGQIPTPWYVRGTVTKTGDGRVEYDLELSQGDVLAAFSTPALTYSGVLATSTKPPLNDSMSLTGWKAYSLGPRSTKEGSSTKIDYGATIKDSGAATIKSLRQRILAARRAEEDPGKNDPTRDFSGFWKQNCDDNFGLRLQRRSKSEPYVDVFCGPGGCGSDAEGRETFVTGDSHYQVVGKDEIRVRRGSDWATYKRCAPAEAAGKP